LIGQPFGMIQRLDRRVVTSRTSSDAAARSEDDGVDPHRDRKRWRGPGDIVLVEGNTRVSTAIKYLTQSTWSHSSLYVGPISGRSEPSGEPHVLVEADVEHGVLSAPASKYSRAHTRICRPIGLSADDVRAVTKFAVDRIGMAYDLRNTFDLLRYLLPTPPVPSRFRRRMIALGAGSPTRAICSTLIAQAFQTINYPILPPIEDFASGQACIASMGSEGAREIEHVRHYSLFAPRDFDISPYFMVVKPATSRLQLPFGQMGSGKRGHRVGTRRPYWADVACRPTGIIDVVVLHRC